MIEAMIFDMDGLLVDSEPFWVEAQIEVFARVGLMLTPELCAETTGLRVDAVAHYWFNRFPWAQKTCLDVAGEIVDRVAELLEGIEPLPGVRELIDKAVARNVKLALCSSSPYKLIRKVVALLGLTELQVLYSGEDEKFGKPHPGAYISTADKLGIPYDRCLVFEDSLNGSIAGKAAGMKVVAVPQGPNLKSTRFDFCDVKIASLLEFDEAYFEFFQIIPEQQKSLE
jgi:HAD superfamily hydrolase (TIGR01509 family)